jgi:5-methylcytosine-specific restriction protein A
MYLCEHPLCVECERKGKLVGANVVDHISPHKGQDDPQFWDERNLQALCPSCHSRKTAQHDGGFGNRR